MKEYVNINVKNGIGIIEFFHPQSNALPSHILKNLSKTITIAGEDDEVKVIILKSGGNRAFCGGASFDELLEINNSKKGKEFFSGFANVINAARKCPKFILGRVQGKAVGGGVGMAAATDYCFATKFASAKLSELAIGIGPFVVGPAVEHKIGNSAFSAMTINSKNWFSAEWMREKGLYTNIFDTAEEMDNAIMELAKNLCDYSPEAMKQLKKIIWENTNHWEELLYERAEISGKLILSDFAQNTIKKIKNEIK